MMTAKILWEIAASVQIFTGFVHLLGMNYTKLLYPRDKSVVDKMKNTVLNVDQNATQWNAWIFFNQTFGICFFLLGLFSFAIAYKDFEIVKGGSIFSTSMIIGSLIAIYFARIQKIRKVRTLFLITTAFYIVAMFL